MSSLPPLRYTSGDLEIDVANRSIRREGQEHFLRPKTFQVLLFLIENRDRPVSKDELLASVWPGTAITEDTLVQSIVDIRKAVGDDSRDPWFIRTIPRRGYQLIAPLETDGALARRGQTAPAGRNVAVEEVRSVAITVEETFDDEPKDWRHFMPYTAVALVVLVLGGIAAALLLRQTRPREAAPPARRTSVAIVPFQNRTDSPDLEWLREGLPEMIFTQLATAPDLTMISGDAVQHQLERKAADGSGQAGLALWLEVAKSAGAERLIAGSFQRIGDQIRVDSQIHEVNDGRVSGGGSIVVGKESLLSEIDLLTSKLASGLGSRLLIAPASRLSDLMTGDLEAYRLYTLGLRAANGLQNQEAIQYLEQAIARDPRFAMAHARMGYVYGVTWTSPERAEPYFARALSPGSRLSARERLYVLAWQAIARGQFAQAIDHLRIIVSRYPMEVEAYDRLGRLLIGEERLEEAIDVLRRGLMIDPESPDLHNSLGSSLSYAGQHAAAIEHHRRYVALSPEDPNSHDSLGLSHQRAGQYQEALAAYDEALRMNPAFEVAVAHRANTFWQLGRNRDAIREYRRYIEMAPSTNERRRGYGELSLIYRSMGDRTRQEEAAREVTRSGAPSVLVDTLVALDRGDAGTATDLVSSAWQSAEPGRGARSIRRIDYYLAAEVARASGNRTAAIQSARSAIRHLAPAFMLDDMEDVLGDAFAAFGEWDEAIAEYKRILTSNPNRGRTRYKLARTLRSAGRSAEAKAEYEQLLSRWPEADPDAPEIIAARKLITTHQSGRAEPLP